MRVWQPGDTALSPESTPRLESLGYSWTTTQDASFDKLRTNGF
jgi:hypothetical protein